MSTSCYRPYCDCQRARGAPGQNGRMPCGMTSVHPALGWKKLNHHHLYCTPCQPRTESKLQIAPDPGDIACSRCYNKSEEKGETWQERATVPSHFQGFAPCFHGKDSDTDVVFMSNRSTAPTGRRRKSDGPNTNTNTNSHKSPRPQDSFNGSINSSRSNGYPNPNSNPSSNPPHTVDDDDDPNADAENTSLLQPRLAVWLGVSRRWHPFLFICRLLSIGPAVWWGFPSVVRLLALVHLKYIMHFAGVGRLSGAAGGGGQGSSYIAAATSAPSGAFLTPTYDWSSSEAKLRFTEAWITVLWCCASGWVSFFLTDCLMSRALLNYTPLATLFRLSVINLLNTLFTSSVLGQFAAPADPRLAFVPWIVIASMLTLIYWAAQRGIRIHKEYSLSLSIFSLASYVSMLALLWHLYIERAIEYPDIPLVHNLKIAFQGAEELALKIMEYGNVTQGL